MPAYASPTPPRSGDVAGTLRLLAYLALSVALMVLDHRGGWLAQIRAQANVVVQPLWWLAGLPARLGDSMRDDAVTRDAPDRGQPSPAQRPAGQRRAPWRGCRPRRRRTQRLRGLLGAAERGGLDVQLAPILDIDLDPTRQRLVLDAGSRDGVRLGQSVIDAGGLVGQIIEVTPTTATVLLLTDPDHAVPVLVGAQRRAPGRLRHGPQRPARTVQHPAVRATSRSATRIITSGLGGRFPPGFPVGTVAALQPDDSRAFLVGDAEARRRNSTAAATCCCCARLVLAPAVAPVTPPATPLPTRRCRDRRCGGHRRRSACREPTGPTP